MNTKLTATLLGGLALAASSLASIPAYADKYIYYPAQQVYFSPERTSYYFMENGTWRVNTAIPPAINLGKSVTVDLTGDTPYVYHSTVIKQYPVTYSVPAAAPAPAPSVIKVDD